MAGLAGFACNGSGQESQIGASFPASPVMARFARGRTVSGLFNSGWQLVSELTKLFRKAELRTEKIFFLWAVFRRLRLMAG